MKNAVGVALLLVGGSLLAQPAPTPTAPTEQTTPTIMLSTADMTARIPELERQVNENTRTVVALQLDARKDKDVVRLNCINDKLLQIKALRNILDGAKLQFEGAATQVEQNRFFASVAASADDIRRQKEEAVACAGEIELEGEAANSFDAPDIPDDPSDPLFEDVLEPPGYASPFS